MNFPGSKSFLKIFTLALSADMSNFMINMKCRVVYFAG